jgi:fibronectin type 3 domain-containing protein
LKILLIILSLIFINVATVLSADVDLTWDQNTESDLAGYRIYHGTSSGNYDINIDIGNPTTYTVSGLIEGETYYLALTAYDTSNNESGYSNEVSYDVPITDSTPPGDPMNMQIVTETVNIVIKVE